MQSCKIGFSKINLIDCMSLVVPETMRRAPSDGVLEKKFDISDRVQGIWRPIPGETRKLVAPLELSLMTGTDADGRWFVVALDVCEISYTRLDSIRKPLAETYGIPEERILCMPSHGHVNLAFQEDSFRRLLLAGAADAVAHETEAEVAAIHLEIDAAHYVINRRVHVEGVGTRTIMFNDQCRVEEDGLVVTEQIRAWIANLGGKPEAFIRPGEEIRTSRNVDPRLQALLFRDAASKAMIGNLVRFACHPVIVSEKKTGGDVSADYPGYLRERLSQHFHGSVTLFAQGQSGDLRPLIREYSHRFAREFGSALADKLIAACARQIEWKPVSGCRFDSEPCVLPFRRDFPRDEKDAADKFREIESRFDAETDICKKRKLQNLYWFYYRRKVIHLVRPEWVASGRAPLRVFSLKINEHVIVANQAEVFSETGRKMIEGFAGFHPISVSICNEELSYIPSLDDFEKGGYEPSVCLTEPGSTGIIVAAAQKLLARCYAGARAAFATVLAALLGVSALAAESVPPWFTRPPAAARAGEKWKIEFAVDRETDVAVFIENAQGQAIRHLAAGCLGKNAPAPLQSNSLSQFVEWDGLADYARPAGAGPFQVRVALGTRPVFQEMIGDDPSDLGPIRSMAVGPNGELYVFHLFGQIHPDDNGAGIVVFNRAGRYVRTIMPYPATLPDERLKGIRRLELPDGRKVPYLYQIETRSYLPGLGNLPKQRSVVTRDGRLAFVGILEGPRPFANPGEARLVVLHTDGSVPSAPLGTRVAWSSDSGANLALSPDEHTLYAAGLRTATHQSAPGAETICEKCDGEGHGNTWNCTRPSHAVYAFGWQDTKEKPRVFAGDPDKPGNGIDQLKDPLSVATDAAGHVYVADRGNDRIAVFAGDGKPVAQIPVARPLRVEVHRKTGAIYVLTGRDGAELELIKFDNRQSGREVCRVQVAGTISFQPTRMPLLALDDTAEPPILYASPLLRMEDRGDHFDAPVSMLPAPAKDAPHSIGSVMELGLDRQREWLYINSFWRYQVAERTWESIAQPAGAREWRPMWPMHSTYSSTGSVGRDGKYYPFIGFYGGRVYRFDAERKLEPFSNAKITKSTEGDPGRPIVGTGHGHGNGHTADADGNVYVIWNKSRSEPTDYHMSQALSSYGPDGALKKDKLINTSIPGIFSPRVDAAGNIYVALGLRPGVAPLPPGLKGLVPDGAEDPDAVNGLNGYPLIYGSIAKFPPTGGEIRDGIGGVVCNFGHDRRIEVKGAAWIVPGASSVPSWATPKRAKGTVTICMCEAACFDVDEFGRSFFADAGRCRVGMLDTAGNEIGWFGTYGNADAVRSAAAEIPLAWPQAIAVGHGSVFVGDRVNRRIVRVKLAHDAEGTVAIP
jgi:sugar lactone lactonase YvrE